MAPVVPAAAEPSTEEPPSRRQGHSSTELGKGRQHCQGLVHGSSTELGIDRQQWMAKLGTPRGRQRDDRRGHRREGAKSGAKSGTSRGHRREEQRVRGCRLNIPVASQGAGDHRRNRLATSQRAGGGTTMVRRGTSCGHQREDRRGRRAIAVEMKRWSSNKGKSTAGQAQQGRRDEQKGPQFIAYWYVSYGVYGIVRGFSVWTALRC